MRASKDWGFDMYDMGNRVKDDGTFESHVHIALFRPQYELMMSNQKGASD